MSGALYIVNMEQNYILLYPGLTLQILELLCFYLWHKLGSRVEISEPQ